MAKKPQFDLPNKKMPQMTQKQKEHDAKVRYKNAVNDPNKHSADALGKKMKARKKLLDSI